MADCGTLLRERVTLKCGSIDRIFSQAYVPKLQSGSMPVRRPVTLSKELTGELGGNLFGIAWPISGV